jgi:Leucine-rich repeat (LRR) protein
MWTNGLEYVHENAFLGLWNLQELHLFGGHLVRFEPNTFAPLPNLRTLEVSSNLIEVLDSRWFANNTFLSRIHFNYNQIYAVAPTILDNPVLTNLQLLANICVDNVFVINEMTRDQVRQELNTCFDAYPARVRWYCMALEGDISLYWSNGTLVGHL